MCTAVSLKTHDLYFGRNLDLDYAYDEAITVMPRHFPLNFDRLGGNSRFTNHLAMIGMAYTSGGYPLYYDAVNESGLAMAGLNFPGYAAYLTEKDGMANILPCEFIPWILSQCTSVSEARQVLRCTNLVDISFSRDLPNTPLHWMIAAPDGCITVEPGPEGLSILDNPVNVLTNSPAFDWHMAHLSMYAHLSPNPPENRFAPSVNLIPFSNGMGAIGLPGDLSSPSRFVKAAFALKNALCGHTESESVNQFFHILRTVEHPRGMVCMKNGAYEITRYSCCMNAYKGIYYCTTYENSRICAVDMHKENLDGSTLIHYPLEHTFDVLHLN